MAHFVFVVKAAFLKRALEKYKKQKLLALTAELEGDDLSDYEKPSWKEKLQKKYKGSALYKYFTKFKRKNTKENICIKSFIGFFGGVLLTYIYFFFFIYGLRLPLQASTYVCAVCGIFFCLGLAFSRKVRCYVLLMIPLFFSKEGRQVLLTYALYLSFTGPVRNTMYNMGILSDSLTCGQEMIRRTLKQIEDMVKAPFRAMKETLSRLAQTLKDVIKKIKEFLDSVKRIILSILHIIKKAVSWLGSIINFCNKKLGTPFQRCMKTFDDAIEDCKAKMGIMDFLCHIVHVVKALCYTVKFLDLICLFTEFVSDSIIGVVKKKLKEFGMQVKNMFYVSIEFTHSYDYKMEASNSTKMVAETVLQKLVEKIEKLDKIFNMLGWAFSFFFIFIFFSGWSLVNALDDYISVFKLNEVFVIHVMVYIFIFQNYFRVFYYKYKYMSSDRYDNRYITSYIYELDLRRLKMNRETVLPLERRERKHFCRPTSLRLLREEQKSILNALLVLSLSTLKILCFIVCDYSLYWVLFTIYREGHREYTEVESAEIELVVSGRGSLAEFYRKLAKALRVPPNPDLHLDPVHCLPDPIPPDKDRYIQIATLTGFCWILTITEAYGLRLRNIVMSHYYPERAKERAVWLYNHILRSRGSFVKFARRQLRRKLQEGGDPVEKVTLKERIFATVPVLGILFGKEKEEVCLLCGAKGTKEEPLRKCYTPDCPGIYCARCYATLNNICTVCQNPIDYGDISDISEERDSSEEGFSEAKSRRRVSFVDRSSSSSEADDSDSDEKVLTFRDVETRPRFRDLEQNPKQDYAKKSDFSPSLEAESKESIEPRNRAEAHELSEESRLLLQLKKRRADKANTLLNRKRKLMNSLQKRLQEQKNKMSEASALKMDIPDAKYSVILKKAKKLTEKLKQRKWEEMNSHDSQSDEENTRPLRKVSKLKNVDYGKLRSIVKAKMKQMKKEEAANYEFNRERRPYSRLFTRRVSNDQSVTTLTSHEDRGKGFAVQFSQCFTDQSNRFDCRLETEVLIKRPRKSAKLCSNRPNATGKRYIHFR